MHPISFIAEGKIFTKAKELHRHFQDKKKPCEGIEKQVRKDDRFYANIVPVTSMLIYYQLMMINDLVITWLPVGQVI